MASCLLPGGSLDGFAQFCLEAGVLEVLEQFPDHRCRRSIPMFFFCNVMVHRPLFQLKRLAPIERTLFRSPYILRQLGFNALQEVLGEGFAKHLLLDRGYLDGAWISQLYGHGTQVVKQDMLVMEEMQDLSRLADTQWREVEPPRLHDGPTPRRMVTGFSDLEPEWAGCSAPLCGCLIRDIYADKVVHRGLVTTAEAREAQVIPENDRRRWFLEETYMNLTRYWQIDDLPPCRLGVAQAMVHFCLLAFTLLGFYIQETEEDKPLGSLNSGPPALPLPERELAVYAGDHFALLLPSELMQIVLDNLDAWQQNKQHLLQALRLCEGVT